MTGFVEPVDVEITIHVSRLFDAWVVTSPDVPGLYIRGNTREHAVNQVPAALKLIHSIIQVQYVK